MADEGYGQDGRFRLALEECGIAYVVGVGGDTSLLPATARRTVVPARMGARGLRRPGRPSVPRYRQPRCSARQLVMDAVAERGHRALRTLTWRTGSKGGLRGRFIALQARQAGRSARRARKGQVLPTSWLLAEWPPGEKEPTRYWLSTLPAHSPLPTLVRLAKIRWRVEHDYRELKTVLGLGHFEGRTWTALHHHLALVTAAHAFCTLERLRPRPAATT